MVRAQPDRLILFVAVPAALGGSNRSLATLIGAFRPHVRCVLASPAAGSFRAFVAERDLVDEHVPLPGGNRLRRMAASMRIARWAIQNRRRIVVIHAQALTGLNLVILAAVITGLPVVVRVSDPESSRFGRLLGPWIRRLIRDLRVLPVSETARDVAVVSGLCSSDEAVVVPNPVDPRDVVAVNRETTPAVLTVGFLGGVSHRKGFDVLHDVVMATADLPLRWLLFVSEPPDSQFDEHLRALKARTDNRVTFRKREADVRRAYAACDVVFVPSRAESFCRVVAEAMANGIPVVATDLPPIRKLLGQELAGLMFPTGDVSAAASMVRTIVGDADLRDVLGEQGRQRAQEYLPEGILRQIAPFYGVSIHA